LDLEAFGSTAVDDRNDSPNDASDSGDVGGVGLARVRVGGSGAGFFVCGGIWANWDLVRIAFCDIVWCFFETTDNLSQKSVVTSPLPGQHTKFDVSRVEFGR
jgi:hypothetical protein